jgi:hypothetical protein
MGYYLTRYFAFKDGKLPAEERAHLAETIRQKQGLLLSCEVRVDLPDCSPLYLVRAES